ncbi:MAG: PfkB family carbohydrate kinase [Anaerolineaceae bacterium]
MALTTSQKPIDYLVIGHITQDLLDDNSSRLGGTASFSGLTAAALGHEVGLLTSCSPETELSALQHLQVQVIPSTVSTTFRNIPTAAGRVQFMYHPAAFIDANVVPESWKHTPIVHLGPVSGEVDPAIYKAFPDSLICLTPQGWLRGFSEDGRVLPIEWSYGTELLQAAHATVLSLEDVRNDESLVESLAAVCKILVITENYLGARVYWNGDIRRFPAPKVSLVEDTGAGDIFAACFFHRLYTTRDPWEAARFAVQLSAYSVTKTHFKSIPTKEEISLALTQVI